MASPTLNIDISNNNKGFIICDNTGKFSKSNKLGWKPGSSSISLVTSPVLIIYVPGSTIPVTIDVAGSMPSLECVCMQITKEDLGLLNFTSGKYKLVYQFILNGSVIQYTEEFYHFNQIECCIADKKNSITNYGSDAARDIYFMSSLLDAAKLAACKGDADSADEILEYVIGKCNCKCC
jgi:hypothetical protein